MWESWAVSWMFHKKWVLFIDPKVHDYDSVEELVFETNAEDIKSEAGFTKIITSPEDFHEVETFFSGKGIEIYESKLDYIPDNEVEITDFDKALKFTKMIEAFEEDEDVNTVSSNELISEALESEVATFIEKNTFRT